MFMSLGILRFFHCRCEAILLRVEVSSIYSNFGLCTIMFYDHLFFISSIIKNAKVLFAYLYQYNSQDVIIINVNQSKGCVAFILGI